MNWFKTHRTPIILSLAMAGLYGFFAYDLVRSDFIRLITMLVSLFVLTWQLIRMYGWNFWLLAGTGLVFRLIFLPAIPNLSQDFYRFLWDGRLILEGLSPYLHTPEAYMNSGLEIVPQAAELYQGMGTLNGSHFSNYPPVNQMCFVISALLGGKSILGPVVVLRLITILADIGILYFGSKLLKLMKLPEHNIFWYFLNPFIIIELTGNLHFEGLMLFFLVLSFYLLYSGKWYWAAVMLGLSISVKLIPLIFLPLYFRYFTDGKLFTKGFWTLKKFAWICLGTVILTFLPFVSTTFLENFTESIGLWFQSFEFNASIYYLARWYGYQTIGWNIIETAGRILPLFVITAVLIFSLFRDNRSLNSLITSMLWVISIYFLFSTTVHPWYIATPLVLSIFTRYRFPILWSLLVMISYSAYTAEGFSENLWLVAIEYIVGIVFVTWEIRKNLRLTTSH